MNPKLLDDDFYTSWGNYVFDNKEILWHGKANIEYNIRFLDGKAYHDVMTGLSSVLIIYLSILISVSHNLYEGGMILTSIILSILGIVFPFLYEIWRSNNHRKTEYALTKNHLLFKVYNGFKYTIKAVPLSIILKTHLEPYDDKVTIHIITNGKVNFSTYNGKNAKKQDHPTLELLKDSEAVNKLIFSLIKSNNITPVPYQEALISENILKVTKYVYFFLLILMSQYLIDYTFFSTFVETDRVVLLEDGVPNELTRNGRYTTEKGYKFSLRSFSKSLLGEDISIRKSFIFSTVTEVVVKKTNRKREVSSGLNHIVFKVSYFLVLIALFIGFVLIYNKKQVTKYLYGKILASLVVYVWILAQFWLLNN